MWCSLVDHAWCTMVCPINNDNSSNSAKMKLVKILNNPNVVCIVASTLPTPKSNEWHVPSFNSLALNMLDELATIAYAKAHCFCLSMFTNISCIISSSLEDEELKLIDFEILKLSLIKLEPWLEDETMISKNPSTWVRNEKEKKWMRGAPTKIVPTHKTKLMCLKQRLWITFWHKVKDYDFELHLCFWGLIVSGDRD